VGGLAELVALQVELDQCGGLQLYHGLLQFGEVVVAEVEMGERSGGVELGLDELQLVVGEVELDYT